MVSMGNYMKLPPYAFVSGEIMYEGKNILALPRKERDKLHYYIENGYDYDTYILPQSQLLDKLVVVEMNKRNKKPSTSTSESI